MGRPKEGVERFPQDNSRSRDAIGARIGVSGRTQQQIAEHSGVSRQYVHKVLSTDKLQCNNSVDTPDHIKTRPHQADFRKLPLELQQKVAAKEGKQRRKQRRRSSKAKGMTWNFLEIPRS